MGFSTIFRSYRTTLSTWGPLRRLAGLLGLRRVQRAGGGHDDRSAVLGRHGDRYGRKLMVQRSMFGGAVVILLMAFAGSAEELTYCGWCRAS